MKKVLIIEDEDVAAESLWEEVQTIREDFQLIDIVDSVKGSVSILKKENPDLIFMDVHLSDGNSFEIFKEIQVKAPIIFTTAFDEYAIDAFNHNSVHYLLKPIDPKKLEEALEKFDAKELEFGNVLVKLNELATGGRFKKRFSAQIRDKIHSIPIEKVAFFLGEDKYVYLFSKEGKKFLIDQTLRELENELDPNDFFRINRKFIVGYSSIVDMLAYSKSRVKLSLDPEPPNPMDVVVSVERSPAFKKWISR